MKVVAVNASPQMDKGNTGAILMPFLDGMKEIGADIDIHYTRKLKIKPCRGEFICQFKTPGVCFQKDDMQMLLPGLAEADILVVATPLYFDGMTGPLKNMFDRMLPMSDLAFELRQGHCRHPLRYGNAAGKVVLVSNCGFWETDNFEPLVAQMKAICQNMNRTFEGALLRPHGPALKPMAAAGAPVDDIFQAAREAGRQLIRDGAMSNECLTAVARELMPLEAYVRSVNRAHSAK